MANRSCILPSISVILAPCTVKLPLISASPDTFNPGVGAGPTVTTVLVQVDAEVPCHGIVYVAPLVPEEVITGAMFDNILVAINTLNY